jgi:nicotinate-nucleotide adenylyltransferase
MFEVQRVLVVPTFQHPFSKTLASFEDRLAMCERAMGQLPRVEISTVERDLGGESRTLRTLKHLAALHPNWSLRLLMGADLVLESHKWHGFPEIQALAPPIVLGRAGIAFEGSPPALLPQVSSTEIREALASGNESFVRGLVPPAVLEYIRARGLYTQS